MTNISNNKIACIFEDISFRTHVNQTFTSCLDQYYLLSKYVTLFQTPCTWWEYTRQQGNRIYQIDKTQTKLDIPLSFKTHLPRYNMERKNSVIVTDTVLTLLRKCLTKRPSMTGRCADTKLLIDILCRLKSSKTVRRHRRLYLYRTRLSECRMFIIIKCAYSSLIMNLKLLTFLTSTAAFAIPRFDSRVH